MLQFVCEKFSPANGKTALENWINTVYCTWQIEFIENYIYFRIFDHFSHGYYGIAFNLNIS